MSEKDKIQKVYEKCIEEIEKDEDILFIQDVIAISGVVSSTFYLYFPAGSEKSDNIKELLTNNRTKLKKTLRNKWKISESTSAQIALYKLAGTKEERDVLNNSDKKEEASKEAPKIQNYIPLKTQK